jgi:predicted amidohydrolase YtcJ
MTFAGSFADLILLGGHLHTLDPNHPSATAVAIADGLIVAVGDDREMRDWHGRRTETINLDGANLTPGLVDGHCHPIWGTLFSAGVDLSHCDDLAAVRDALAAAAETTPIDGWIRGWGLDPNAFGTTPITRAVIDDILGDRPGYLVLFDGHSALASSEALRRAGVDSPRRFDSQSAIVCDDRDRPTGHLLEEGAMSLVDSRIPVEPLSERLRHVRGLLGGMAATGLTGAHVMDTNGDTLDLLSALEDGGELPLRLRLAPWCRPDDEAEQLQELLTQQGRHGRLWEVAAVKFFMDGTIDGGTAWLHAPDSHGESTHPYWRDPQSYSDAVGFFVKAGVQTATHAIGDAAVTHVLDTLEAAGASPRGVPHRVEHIETLPADQISRFAELGVIASMQPSHATDFTRADHSDNWSVRLGEERANRAWPCRDLIEAGASLVLGSDWPIAPYDPRTVLAAAQLRRPATRPDLAPVRPEQALTASQALHGYTSGPAKAASQQHQAGRIAVGFRADLTAFADNPLTTPGDDLVGTEILLTVVDGRVHRHGS